MFTHQHVIYRQDLASILESEFKDELNETSKNKLNSNGLTTTPSMNKKGNGRKIVRDYYEV